MRNAIVGRAVEWQETHNGRRIGDLIRGKVLAAEVNPKDGKFVLLVELHQICYAPLVKVIRHKGTEYETESWVPKLPEEEEREFREHRDKGDFVSVPAYACSFPTIGEGEMPGEGYRKIAS